MANKGIFSLGETELELSNGAWISDPQYGYYFGGNSPSAPSPLSTSSRISFANDTVSASNRGNLQIAVSDSSVVNDLKNYGYVIGGYAPGPNNQTSVQRIDFSNDTANLKNQSSLTFERYGGGQFFTENHGWVVGGSVEPASPRERTYVDRLSFANDSLYMSIRGPLSSARYKGSSVQNDSYGWFSGGYGIAGVVVRHTRVDRLDFTSDLAVTSVRRNDTIGGSGSAGVSSKIYGWSVGQRSTGVNQGTSVERMTFANDTATAVLRGPTLVAKFNHTGSYNSSSGWIGGGRDALSPSNFYSRIDRFNYENDLASFSARGNFDIPKQVASATQGQLARKVIPLNAQNIWIGGGIGGGVFNSSIERFNLSSDTTNAQVRSYFPSPLYGPSGTTNGNYGWWGGGYTPTPNVNVTTVTRTNYSNDTTNSVAVGSLSVARHNSDGASTPDYGWYIGGRQPALSSRIDRIDFSNDNPNASERVNLTTATGNHGVSANYQYAYVAGGSGYTYIQRLNLQNDLTSSSNGGNLSQKRRYYRGFGNNSYGYFAGGDEGIPASRSDIDRLDYASDTTATIIRGNISHPTDSFSASGNNSYGYVFAGNQYPGPNPWSTSDRIDYSTDTSTTITRGNLTKHVSNSHALLGVLKSSILNPNSTPFTSQYGYVAGGGPAANSLIQRIHFNNDNTTTPVRGSLTAIKTYPSGISNNSYGWIAGGFVPGPNYYSTIERLDVQNDSTNTSVRGPLNGEKIGTYGFVNETYGWFAGGNDLGAGGYVSTTDRLELANDLPTTSARGNLSGARYLGGFASTADHGYTFAGYVPGPTSSSTIDRFVFASDLTAATARATMPENRAQLTTASNGSYAWSSNDQGNGSTVWRFDFSNDQSSPPTRGDLSAGRRNAAASGNANYGWFAGGQTSVSFSTIDRVDYSNDNALASVRGPLSNSQRSGASFSALATKSLTPVSLPKTATYGWYAGAFTNTSPPQRSSIERIDFANDLSIATRRSQLTAATENSSSGYNSSSSWTNRGYSPSTSPTGTSIIDRLDFDNDNVTTSIRGNLANSTQYGYSGTTTTKNYGWWATSENAGSPSRKSLIERLEYANDLSNATIRSNLSSGERESGPGASTLNYGYYGGGLSSSGQVSTIDRLSFMNDTAGTVSRGPLTTARRAPGAVNTQQYGWWGGGSEPGYFSTIERLDFSNDQTAASARGPLTFSGDFTTGTNNNDYGYFAGARAPAISNSISLVCRIDFSNDSPTASARGNLSLPSGGRAGSVNK